MRRRLLALLVIITLMFMLPAYGEVLLSPALAGSPMPQSAMFRLYPVHVRYYYHQLTNNQKAVFAQMYDAICSFNDQVDLDPAYPCDAEEMNHVIDVIWNDCPEPFQRAAKYSCGTWIDRVVSVLFTYDMDAAQYEKDYRALVSALRGIARLPGFHGDEYDQQLAIYRHIIDLSDYRMNELYSTKAAGPLVYGYGQCEGYAEALCIALRFYGLSGFYGIPLD